MARSNDKNCFLIVSGNLDRIAKISDVVNKSYANTSVFHAADWVETKYKLENVFPKVILVDEYLPKSSGLDLVTKLQKDKNCSNVYIIIMSIVADHDRFPAGGKVLFLTEPDDEEAILDCISKIIAPKNPIEKPEYNLRHLKAGEVLFKEGDESRSVYIVKNGTLRAYSDSLSNGGRITLGDISAGEFVGEMGHFNHEPRSATVEATSEVDLVEIPMASLENVIFSKPSWAKALVKTLSQRLKRANKVLTG